MDMQQAVRDLQDAMVLMAHIEKRQSEDLEELLEFRHRTEQNLAEITDKLTVLIGAHTEDLGLRRRSEQELMEFRRRTEQNLAEITDKLNGRIGYIDSSRPRPQ
jgi:DNA repair exonuclease SbcCD ATPase subunit